MCTYRIVYSFLRRWLKINFRFSACSCWLLLLLVVYSKYLYFFFLPLVFFFVHESVFAADVHTYTHAYVCMYLPRSSLHIEMVKWWWQWSRKIVSSLISQCHSRYNCIFKWYKTQISCVSCFCFVSRCEQKKKNQRNVLKEEA